MTLVLNYIVYLIGLFIKTCLILATPYIVGLAILATHRNRTPCESPDDALTDKKKTSLVETNIASGINDYSHSTGIDSSGTNDITAVRLNTVYELKESPAVATFDVISGQDTTEHATLTRQPSTKTRSLQPSLSSPPSMDSSHYSRRRANTQPFNHTYSARTPPLIMSPSVSTSTTDSQQTQSPVLSPSSSLQRRNSRVGQLVQQFEMGRIETTRSTPIKMGSMNKVSDTIASLTRMKDDTKPRCYRPAPIITSDPASPTVCSSPMVATDRARTVDHRSIGFRPVFSTWEDRATVANSSFVPLPSLSTPVRSPTRRLSKTG